MIRYSQWVLNVDEIQDEQLKPIGIEINAILATKRKIKKLNEKELQKQNEMDAERIIQRLASISLSKGHSDELDVLKNYAFSILNL